MDTPFSTLTGTFSVPLSLENAGLGGFADEFS